MSKGEELNLKTDLILIAGPTASGKSSLAIDLAERENGVIINADSMQIYQVLRVITARPSVEEGAAVPHRLFGHVHPSVAWSVSTWLGEAEKEIASVRREGKLPILVGGTGLYFSGLIKGISEIPAIDPAVRDKWRAREAEGAQKLHEALSALDPAAAEVVRPSDPQRILRALEVAESTGRSLLSFQGEGLPSPLYTRQTTQHLLVMPDRKTLHTRINTRFDNMIEAGAVEEVRELIQLNLEPALPAMKAIGVPQLKAAIEGEISFDEAIERSKAATRQYAKRQSTWFRNQFSQDLWQVVQAPFADTSKSWLTL